MILKSRRAGTPVHVPVPNHKKASILESPISSSLTILQQRLFKIKQLKVRYLSGPGALQLSVFFLVQHEAGTEEGGM